jgi:hypothetical protein
VQYVGHYTLIIQTERSLHHKQTELGIQNTWVLPSLITNAKKKHNWQQNILYSNVNKHECLKYHCFSLTLKHRLQNQNVSPFSFNTPCKLQRNIATGSTAHTATTNAVKGSFLLATVICLPVPFPHEPTINTSYQFYGLQLQKNYASKFLYFRKSNVTDF